MEAAVLEPLEAAESKKRRRTEPAELQNGVFSDAVQFGAKFAAKSGNNCGF